MSTTTILYLLLLSLTTTTTTAITTVSSDITALKALKASILPSTIPSYTCLHSWDFTSDPCSPPHATTFLCGLSCSGNRVTQLTLDPAGYSGTLPPLLSQLTQLITIDLSDNHFHGPIPTSIFTLPNLQTLILGSNSFSGVIPPTISKTLQTLDISHNSLSGSLPNSLPSLTGLTRLDLSFNKLTGPIPELPKNLVELALKGNSLSGYLDKQSFTGLTQLEVVELSENSLTGTIPGWFFLLPNLQQVNLANNNFTGVEILKPTDSDSNLIAVDLGFNQISGYPPANISAYPMLASLTLSYNKLRGNIPGEYSKLSRLFLDGNYLIGSPAELFSGKRSISGSLGDNCLKSCPVSSELCLKKQKPWPICQQAYGGKLKPRS